MARLILGAAGLVGGVGVLGLGFTMARVQMFTALFFIAVGSGLAIVGGIAIDRVLTAMRMRVLLFDGGFVWADEEDVRGYRWDQIASVHLVEIPHCHHGRVIYRTHSFEITSRDGHVVWLEKGDLRGNEELGQAIARAVRNDKTRAAQAAALRLEADGQWESALAIFERIAAESPDADIAAEARVHSHRLRQRAVGESPRPA